MAELGGVSFSNRAVSSEPILKVADAFLATGLIYKSIWPHDHRLPDSNQRWFLESYIPPRTAPCSRRSDVRRYIGGGNLPLQIAKRNNSGSSPGYLQ